MVCEKLFVNWECKGHSAAEGLIEGYGAIFGNIDLGSDEIQAGAFAKSIVDHKHAGTQPAMFFGHDSERPIGEWTEFREDKNGLFMKGRMWINDEAGKFAIDDAKLAFNMLSSKGMRGLSIGYSIKEGGAEMVKRKNSDGREQNVRLLKELDLFEVSAVSIPMNPLAQTTSIKGLHAQWDKRTLEEGLRNLGMSRSEAQTLLSKGFRGLSDSGIDNGSDSQDAKAVASFLDTYKNTLKGLSNV